MSDLFPEWRIGEVILTEAPYMVPIDDSVDYGSPESVTEVIRSMFLDGDYEVSSKAGNRTVVLPVLIEDSDLAALADAEEALALECDRAWNEVYVDPGDGFAAPFIFDVFPNQGSLQFSRSDKYEKNGYRAYTLTFRARPFSKSVNDAVLTPTPTDIGTARQRMHEIDVEGSARSEASISVQHSTTSLGDVLLFSYQDDGSDYSPSLRQFVSAATDATATTDAATVSGKRNNLDGAATFQIPGDRLTPGLHVPYVLARTSAPGTPTIEVIVSIKVGAVTRWSTSWFFDLDTADEGISPTSWHVVDTGQGLLLPQIRLGDPAFSTVQITFVDVDTSGVDVDLDEAWLFNLTAGELTWVECGAEPAAVGGPAKRLFVDAPTSQQPRPAILIGHSSDKSDAYFPDDIMSWGRHVLAPGPNRVLAVTTNTTSAVTEITHPKRWHTHARS